MRPVSFDTAYRQLLYELLESDAEEHNARTDTRIKLIRGGHSFKLDLSDGLLPVAGNRRYFPRVAAAEVAWQFMGTKNPEFILAYAPKLWSKFVEDGELKTAYGWRWRKAFGRDQLSLAIKELRTNPTNRQLYISAWDPRCDGLGGDQHKNIPCPIGFTLSRFENELHMSVMIRSSDVMVGLPYDVMCYALTLDAIAVSAGCLPATLHVTLAHPHLYEPHWEMATQSFTKWKKIYKPPLPDYSVESIMLHPDEYVAQVSKLTPRETNDWDPMPGVIE